MTGGWLVLVLSPPKPLDQSKNVTVRTFHIWPGSVHEHIFLVVGGARGPQCHVVRPEWLFDTLLCNKMKHNVI